MIKVKKSRFTTQMTSQSAVSSGKSSNTSLATTSRTRAAKEGLMSNKISIGDGDDYVSQSSMQTSIPGTSMGSVPITIDTDPMLVGLMPNNYKILYALYRDIYYNDPIGGSAVDLFARLPFSDFSLGGIEDDKIMGTFMENVERLGAKTLMPDMSVDHLVLGMHCNSLVYNSSKKMFVDLIPYAPEQLLVQTLPFYSQDPVITANFTDDLQKLMQTKSPRIERLRNLMGAKVFDQIRGGTLELDPLTTVYIPRTTFADTDMGVSWYRRLLPLYLIEKNLYRGTLVESARRQRGILHLMLGDGDNWIPSPEDLEFFNDMFLDADMDPLGAIISTRNGVQVNELRQGGDFWKVTDFSDSVLPQKLRALSISEAFLSQDANYNVNDSSMTVFIDSMSSFRDLMTRKFYYEKVFPLISMANGFTLNSKGKVLRKEGLMESLAPEEIQFMLNDGSRLLIPSVTYNKQLKPEGDQAHMDMLQAMSEKGVPVPMRVLAAAGGLNLDEMVRQQDDDLAIRKRLIEYQDAIKALQPQDVGGEEGDMDAEASSRLHNVKQSLAALPAHRISGTKSAVQSLGGPMNLMSRDYGENSELYQTTATGKKTLLVDQKAANERINNKITKAMRDSGAARRANARRTVKK